MAVGPSLKFLEKPLSFGVEAQFNSVLEHGGVTPAVIADYGHQLGASPFFAGGGARLHVSPDQSLTDTLSSFWSLGASFQGLLGYQLSDNWNVSAALRYTIRALSAAGQEPTPEDIKKVEDASGGLITLDPKDPANRMGGLLVDGVVAPRSGVLHSVILALRTNYLFTFLDRPLSLGLEAYLGRASGTVSGNTEIDPDLAVSGWEYGGGLSVSTPIDWAALKDLPETFNQTPVPPTLYPIIPSEQSIAGGNTQVKVIRHHDPEKQEYAEGPLATLFLVLSQKDKSDDKVAARVRYWIDGNKQNRKEYILKKGDPKLTWSVPNLDKEFGLLSEGSHVLSFQIEGQEEVAVSFKAKKDAPQLTRSRPAAPLLTPIEYKIRVVASQIARLIAVKMMEKDFNFTAASQELVIKIRDILKQSPLSGPERVTALGYAVGITRGAARKDLKDLPQYLALTENFLDDIYNQVWTDVVEIPRHGLPSQGNFSLDTGKLLSQTSYDFEKQFDIFKFAGGIFTTTDTSKASIFLKGEWNLFKKEWGNYHHNLDLGIAAVTVFPSYGQLSKHSTVIAAMPSMNWFNGLTFSPTDFLTLRAGAEVFFAGAMGSGFPIFYSSRNSAGASIIAHSENAQLSLGARIDSSIGVDNVQGRGFNPIRFEELTPFADFKANLGDQTTFVANVETPYSRAGLDFGAQVGVYHDFSFGQFGFGARGNMAVYSKPILRPPSVNLFAQILFGETTSLLGQHTARIQATPSYINVERRDHKVSTGGDSEAENEQQNFSRIVSASQGTFFDCSPSNGDTVCKDRDGKLAISFGSCTPGDSENSITCNKVENDIPAPGYRASVSLEKDVYTGAFHTTGFAATFDSPLLQTIQENPSLEGFTQAFDRRSWNEKMPALEFLMKGAYGTYDTDGQFALMGSGNINNITHPEMFRDIRELFLTGVARKGTVCRGNAPFVTSLAMAWGAEEAYCAIIFTEGQPHVLAIIRPPHGDYTVIDFGYDRFESEAGNLIGLLDGYTQTLVEKEGEQVQRYMPPLVPYQIYDYKGDFFKSLKSELTETIEQKALTRSRMKPFLTAPLIKQ